MSEVSTTQSELPDAGGLESLVPNAQLEEELYTHLGMLVMEAHWRLFGEVYVDLQRNSPERSVRLLSGFVMRHPEITEQG